MAGPESDGVHAGGCLCGAVRFELRGALPPAVNCHCRFCRRAHGSAFVTIAWVQEAGLRFVRGEDALVRHESPAGYRAFCVHCGARLFAGLPGSGFLSLALGSLDDPPARKPIMHVNVESKAPWYEIRDDLPQFLTLPPGVERSSSD